MNRDINWMVNSDPVRSIVTTSNMMPSIRKAINFSDERGYGGRGNAGGVVGLMDTAETNYNKRKTIKI